MPGVTSGVFGHPVILGVVSFVAMWIAAWLGAAYVRRRYALDEKLREDFGVILAAALTLLGLIIGFSFSVATGRYDQRKNYEEAEANAIGTEYLRADLLPSADAAKVRALPSSSRSCGAPCCPPRPASRPPSPPWPSPA